MSDASASPEISVVIATRDRAALLRRAMRSALDQLDVDHEVVVVDDGSTDATAETVAALDDPRVRLVRLPRSSGVAPARNAGIARARAPWLAFLDDDDVWAPSRLREHLDIGERAGATMVYGARIVIDAQGRPVRAVLAERPETVAETLRWGNVIGSPSLVTARSDAVRRAGGFDVRLSALADWKLWLDLLSVGTAAACTEFLAAYTEHSGNMHLRDPRGVLREFEVLAAGGRWGLQRDSFLDWLASELVADGRRSAAARVHLHVAARERSMRPLARGLAALAGLQASERDGRPLAAPAWVATAAAAAEPVRP